MQTISINYTLVWVFKNYSHIKITVCKKVINTKTGRILKQCLNGGSIGYWLDKKTFIVKSKINENIKKIELDICPF